MNALDVQPEEKNFHVVVKPNPLNCETVFCQFKHGLTIAEALGEGVSQTAEVIVGGIAVPRAMWSKVRPSVGTPVEVMMYPQGGSAGKWIRLVIMVVIMYFSAGAAGGMFASGGMFAAGSMSAMALSAGMMLVGTLALNALIPPPTPKGLGGAGGDPFQQLNSLTGTSNQAAPYGVIPLVVGTKRFSLPTLASGEEATINGRRFWRPVVAPGEIPRDVAIHEAGHAIASWWTGKGLARVRVGEAGEGGFTESVICYIEGSDEASIKAFCKGLTRKELNDRVLRELVQAMAGPMAEARLKGYGLSWQAMLFDPGYREWHEGDPPSDLHAWTATSLLTKPKDRKRVANGSVSVCANMLAAYWPQVEALADALQVQREMTAEQVLAAIEQVARAPLCPLSLGSVELTA